MRGAGKVDDQFGRDSLGAGVFGVGRASEAGIVALDLAQAAASVAIHVVAVVTRQNKPQPIPANLQARISHPVVSKLRPTLHTKSLRDATQTPIRARHTSSITQNGASLTHSHTTIATIPIGYALTLEHIISNLADTAPILRERVLYPIADVAVIANR